MHIGLWIWRLATVQTIHLYKPYIFTVNLHKQGVAGMMLETEQIRQPTEMAGFRQRLAPTGYFPPSPLIASC